MINVFVFTITRSLRRFVTHEKVVLSIEHYQTIQFNINLHFSHDRIDTQTIPPTDITRLIFQYKFLVCDVDIIAAKFRE